MAKAKRGKAEIIEEAVKGSGWPRGSSVSVAAARSSALPPKKASGRREGDLRANTRGGEREGEETKRQKSKLTNRQMFSSFC